MMYADMQITSKIYWETRETVSKPKYLLTEEYEIWDQRYRKYPRQTQKECKDDPMKEQEILDVLKQIQFQPIPQVEIPVNVELQTKIDILLDMIVNIKNSLSTYFLNIEFPSAEPVDLSGIQRKLDDIIRKLDQPVVNTLPMDFYSNMNIIERDIVDIGDKIDAIKTIQAMSDPVVTAVYDWIKAHP
jgi:hypothetical protein